MLKLPHSDFSHKSPVTCSGSFPETGCIPSLLRTSICEAPGLGFDVLVAAWGVKTEKTSEEMAISL